MNADYLCSTPVKLVLALTSFPIKFFEIQYYFPILPRRSKWGFLKIYPIKIIHSLIITVLYALSTSPSLDILLIFGKSVHFGTFTAVLVKGSVSRDVSKRSKLRVKGSFGEKSRPIFRTEL
jgi:hypothetical protein